MYRILMIILFLAITGVVPAQQVYENLLKAKSFNKSGKPGQAIDLLTLTLASNDSDSRLYLERAEARLIKGDYSGAILDFNIANKHLPYSGEYGLARIYALRGDAATAVYHLERNLSSDFRKSEKDIMLDPAFSIIENKPEWRQLWKSERYSILEKTMAEIEYDLSKGNIEGAENALSEIESAYRENDKISYLRALISFSSQKYADAVKILAPLTREEQTDEKILRLYAISQMGVPNPAGASETYSRLIGMEVADAGLLISRAECFMKTGEYEKAKSDIEKYLSIDPVDKTALSMAGKIEATVGDNLKALTYFTRNLDLHPDDPGLYIDRANSYFNSKSWKWAISDFSMALDLRPDNAEAWLSKGLALLNSGKTADACHDFQKSFNLGNRKAAGYISRNCIK